MKNLKKLVSVILTVAMLVSSLAALSVSAAYDDVDASNSYAKAIEVLSGLSIAKGDEEGNFNPTADVKRSEMVAFICRMKGEESIATATGSKFDDVAENHWANGYINWGVDNGIIKGYGDGNFGPDASVTYQDALVMILRAAGWERVCERSDNGGYPAGYIKIAKQQGLTAGITFSTEKAATREVVAQAIYNGLTMPTVAISKYASNPDDDEYTIYDGSDGARRTLLTYTNEIYKVKAVVVDTAKSNPALRDEDGNYVELDIEDNFNNYTLGAAIPSDLLASDETVDVLVGDSNIADYHKYTVEAYIAEYDVNDWVVLAVVPDTKSIDTVTVKANTNRIVGLEGDVFTYRETKKSTKDIEIELADTLEVYYNGQALSDDGEDGYYEDLEAYYEAEEDTIDLAALLSATYAEEITFVGANDVYSTIFVVDYAYAQVEEVVEDDAYISTDVLDDINLDLEDREGDIVNLFDAEGNAIELADIAEDDILNIVAPLVDGGYDVNEANYVDIYVTSNAVTGAVDEDHLDGTFTIEGNVYGSLVELTAGAEGTFYITIDGKVYVADAEVSISKNFAILLGHEVATKFSNSVVEIQAYTTDDVIKTFTVASTIKVNGTSYKRTTSTGNLQTDLFGDAVVDGDNYYTDSDFAELYAGADSDSEDDTTADLKSRLFSYKTNSDGELIEIRFADTTPNFISDTHDGKYNADAEVFDNFDAVADTLIITAPYDGTDIDTEKLGITAFGALDDEDHMLNYYVLNDNDEIAIATIADVLTSATSGSHFAVVTGVGSVFDKANDGSVAQYTFIQSGAEVKAKVAYGSDAAEVELNVGDIFRYGVDANGNIDTIEPVTGAFGNSEEDDEYAIEGTVTDAGTTSSGKRYIIVGGNRVLFATDDASTLVSIDTRDGELDEADIKVLASAAGIKKSTSRTTYEVIALCDEDGNIIDAVMYISDAE